MLDVATIDMLAKLANIIGAPALFALLWVVWRFDRRVYKLEILVENFTAKKEPSP
jgi:hypothetical protein